MEIITAKKQNLKITLSALKDGEILVCPTDTVYGLICDASNSRAVEKIFRIKSRPRTKPLPVFVKDIKMAKNYAFLDGKQEEFLENNKITVILKAKKPHKLSPLVYKKGTIGIRIPKYKFLNSVLDKFGKPLAQTSANISGAPATTKIKEVLEQFKNKKLKPDLIVDAGDLPESRPSKVIDLSGAKVKILRS